MTNAEDRVLQIATDPAHCRKTNAELAELAGVSVSTVSRALRAGVEAELIQIHRLTPGPGDSARIIRPRQGGRYDETSSEYFETLREAAGVES